MPTSLQMPDVRVYIAFNAGFLTPAASRTWTDVTDYVELAELITITGGRSDERSQADANQLSLTLDNRDGRFTPGKTGGAYYPNVKLDRPIWVTATPIDGAISTRFLGFISEWPVSWEGTDGYAKVTVNASSRLARLGSVASLQSVTEEVILGDSPVAYYTLGEPEGATQANDSSGNPSAQPLSIVVSGDGAAPVFGQATGPGTDGLTALQTTTTAVGGAGYLASAGPQGTAPAISFETFFLHTNPPAFDEGILSAVQSGTAVFPAGLALRLSTTGTIILLESNGTTALTSIGASAGTNYSDSAIHHVACVANYGTATAKVYVDGVEVISAALTAATGIIRPIVAAAFTGVTAHVAFFDYALTPTQVAAHANSGRTGFAGDTTSARFARYAAYAGLESAAVTSDTGQTTVQHIDTTDKQVVELIRLIETTEGGVLFDDRDGTITLHNRTRRTIAASAFTLDMAQQMVESNYTPKLDRSGIANDVTASDVTGKFTARRFDATSQADNGVATLSVETASEDDDEPLFQAGWALYRNKTPLPRVAQLTVNALAQVGKTPNCAAVMAANVSTKITVSNRPTQDTSSSASFFVEGYSEIYGPESLFITWNVSPSSPDDQTLMIGDPTRGVIGTNPVAL